MQELVDKLNYYRNEYYNNSKSIISDKEYDDLFDRLKEMENETGITLPNSPTQTVGYQVLDKLEKVAHNHPMLSLDKTKEISELKSFIGDKDYVVMPKMDGLTISLRYLDGELVSAETRGNGIEGELVTHNARIIKSIPQTIDYKKELIVDGEIICTFEDFKEFENEYANPRNFASGSIRLLDSKECSKRKLTFVAWEVIKGFETEDSNSFSTNLNALTSFGFTVVDNCHSGNIEDDIELMKYFAEKRSYPIDGMVIKFDDIKYGKSLGATAHHARNAIAYKFYDECYETTLLDIEWGLGKTGVLTPIAVFEPIEADFSTISKASLHNVSVMLDTLGHSYKGEKIWVCKQNAIIPQVIKAEKKDLTISEFRCENCPVCNAPTELKNNDGILTLWCTNPSCEGKLLNRIENFFGKSGLNAKGISKATIEKLIDWGWVNSISDMFELSRYESEWKNKSGFGEKSVKNILESIRKSSNTDIQSILAGANIPLVGRAVAKELAQRYDSYDSFKEDITGNFDFSCLNGFGYEMNKSLKTFNYKELDKIVKNYLIIEKNNDIINIQNKLNNLTFVVTGKVKQVKNRNELQAIIEQNGGKVSSSVSKNTSYLIANEEEDTSKYKKALDLNIPIINEEEFFKMI